MKFELDLLSCRDFGECVGAAPQIFSLDSKGRQSVRNDATTDLVVIECADDARQSVEEAAVVCPMQAIKVPSN